MPAQMASISNQVIGQIFGGAAPHEDFPAGGMRAGGSVIVSSLATTAGSRYLLGDANISSIVVSPESARVATYTAALQSSTTFLPVVSTFFRKWICRYLRFRYLPSVGTDSSDWDGVGNITLAYDADGPVQAAAYTTTVTRTLLGGARNVTFTPSIPAELVAIPREKAARDDELQWITGVSDSVLGTTTPAEVRTIMQGAMFAVAGGNATAGSVGLGVLWCDYEFDLYGFTNMPSLTNATMSAIRVERSAGTAAGEQKSARAPAGALGEEQKGVGKFRQTDTEAGFDLRSGATPEAAESDWIPLRTPLRAGAGAPVAAAKSTAR